VSADAEWKKVQTAKKKPLRLIYVGRLAENKSN